MTVMRRWLDSDQAPPQILALLKNARPPTALDPATRARSRRRLAAVTALPVTVGVSFWLKSVALGAVLGSAATVAVVLPDWREVLRSEQKVPSARPTTTARPSAAPTLVRSVGASEVDAGVAAPTRAPIATSGAASVSRPLPPTPTTLDDNLGREIQLLERARQLLAVDPNRALSTLNEHQREFGSGTLGLERQFLEIEALLRLGKRELASQRAAALRARAPGSLYERRLEQLLDSKNE